MTEQFGNIEYEGEMAFARCGGCGATGPREDGLGAAEHAAWAAGWHRVYQRGWRCPKCYERRKKA